MIDLKEVIEFENEFPGGFTDVREKPFGKLFYNLHNPWSYDSNHAIILNLDGDLDQAFEEIIRFYENIQVTPRIYQAFQSQELTILKPYLKKYGFTHQEYDNDFLVYQNQVEPQSAPDIQISRVNTVSSGIVEMILSEDQGDWTAKVLERHLSLERFHLLVGYLDQKPVTMASVNMKGGLSRVDDVMTHRDYRGQGYARKVIHYLVDYHAAISKNILYLYASNPIALKIYREIGFIDFPAQLKMWSAWKQ